MVVGRPQPCQFALHSRAARLAPVPGSRAYGGWGASEWAVNPRVFDLYSDQGEAHRARRATVRDLLGGGHGDA